MNDYAWDLHLLITYLLPTFLRQPNQIGWLSALLSPVDTKHSAFVSFVADKRYQLDFTGQVISLERLLNDAFDATLRRIYIGEGNRQEVFIFNGDGIFVENNETYFFQGPTIETEVFVFNGENNTLLYDFTVNLPTALVYDASLLSSLIKRYKLAGKKYVILTF
jgi:hypothetical protein